MAVESILDSSVNLKPHSISTTQNTSTSIVIKPSSHYLATQVSYTCEVEGDSVDGDGEGGDVWMVMVGGD